MKAEIKKVLIDYNNAIVDSLDEPPIGGDPVDGTPYLERIMQLINKPVTLSIPCEKCGGSGRRDERSNFITGSIKPICTCDNGNVKRTVCPLCKGHVTQDGLCKADSDDSCHKGGRDD